MNDLISRQAAIDAVKSYWKNEVDRIPKKSTDFDVITQICDLILTHNANICKAIDKLPPAQPERKRGKWITVNGRFGDEVECDKCKSVFWYWMANYRYCPSCGSDNMRGESE